MAFDAREHNADYYLQTPMGEIPDSQFHLPGGHYWSVLTRYEMSDSPWTANTAAATLYWELTEPGEDVSEESLINVDPPVAGREARRTYELTPFGFKQLRGLMTSYGHDTVKYPLEVLLPESIGKRTLLTLAAEPSKKDPERIYNNVTAAAGTGE